MTSLLVRTYLLHPVMIINNDYATKTSLKCLDGDKRMRLNRLQIQILKKNSSELNLEIEDYLLRFSERYIRRAANTLDELTEKEGDIWITKAYVESLG